MLNMIRVGTLISAMIIWSVLLGCSELIIPRNVSPEVVCKGDLATASYTVRLDDGALLYTTVPEIADNPETRRSPWYMSSEHFGPELIVAGGENMIPGLGDFIIGLKKGQRTVVTIPPERVYGTYEQDGVYHFDRVSIMPRILYLSREEYRSIFSVEPVVDENVNLVPYFTSRIIQISDQGVVLESVVENSMHYEEEFGSVNIRPENDDIMIELTPNKDALFNMDGAAGRIADVNERSFTVDMNHPLAGKTLRVDLEILSLIKASNVSESIDWLEDHDNALSFAKKHGKAVVLVLYCDSCWWCEKLMDETLTDPRIRILNNEYVWIRVDTGKQKNIYDFYNQVGYPLIVILDKYGTEIDRIEGFVPAHRLRGEFDKLAERKGEGRTEKTNERNLHG
ncbi:MAG TPA: DUF255 domain-containing protein [Deltaproteobacteria bacterium]|nr:DUF255 domain-containing protein [Deltaproteobacteria bacterium]